MIPGICVTNLKLLSRHKSRRRRAQRGAVLVPRHMAGSPIPNLLFKMRIPSYISPVVRTHVLPGGNANQYNCSARQFGSKSKMRRFCPFSSSALWRAKAVLRGSLILLETEFQTSHTLPEVFILKPHSQTWWEDDYQWNATTKHLANTLTWRKRKIFFSKHGCHNVTEHLDQKMGQVIPSSATQSTVRESGRSGAAPEPSSRAMQRTCNCSI